MLKTANFWFWKTISIVPSLHSKFSGCEKKLEKWCFDETGEGEEGRKFCQTMWVHDKVITKDIFLTQFCLFDKTTACVCINWDNSLCLHVSCFCNHKTVEKPILLFVITIAKSYMLSVSYISMVCMLWYELHNMNNDITAEICHLNLFCMFFLCQKTIAKLYWVTCGFEFRIMIFLPSNNEVIIGTWIPSKTRYFSMYFSRYF